MKAGIALGSNLGDRITHLERGFVFLRKLSSGHFLRSSVIETEPIDCPPEAGLYLNAVAEIDYEGTARELLNRLKTFEREEGRDLDAPFHASRPIDLDILYLGDQRISEPDLIVPHLHLSERRFVLEPLAEIAPDLILPGLNRSIQDLLHELQT